MHRAGPQPLDTLPDRLEAAAGSRAVATFVEGGRGRAGAVLPAPRRGPGHGRRPAGPRSRPRLPCRAARTDQPPVRHRHPGGVAGGRHPRRPPAADAAGVARGVRRQTRTRIRAADTDLVVVDPDLAPFLDRRSRATRRRCCSSDLPPGPGRPRGRRPRPARGRSRQPRPCSSSPAARPPSRRA